MTTTADLVLDGGLVLTMASGNGNGGAPAPTAVAVKGNRIVAVGSDEAMAPWLGPDTTRIPLAGRVVTPGFADTHCHLGTDSRYNPKDRVECRDFYAPIKSVDDILRRISEAAERTPPGETIVGTGSPMQDQRLAERRRPTREEMDAAAPDHPAYVTFGAHVLVANTKAIEASGVGWSPVDPQGGMYERDGSGRFTGVARERAQIPFRKLEKIGDFEGYKDNIEAALQLAASRGVTTIHDIVKDRDEVRAYQELRREGRLPIRVQMIIRVIESGFKQWSLHDLGIQHGLGDDLLKIGGIKMSIDGGFTGRQSAWSAVDDEPEGNHPLIRITQDELDEAVREYDAAGMRICVHAIGDIASGMILSAYEKALGNRSALDVRHRVEHLGNWLFTDEKIEKAKQLGVTPVPNPSIYHFLAAEAVESIGARRNEEAFPIRRIIDEGMVFAPGADSPGYWPVDPLRDVGACITRETYSGVVLAADQAIGNADALAAITTNAAWLGHSEDRLGTVEAGKLADLVVLPANPLTVDGAEFGTLPVDLTIADGVVVSESAG